MAGPVPAPIVAEAWREVPDPHAPALFKWRCRACVFEFYNIAQGKWYERDSNRFRVHRFGVPSLTVVATSPEREALWLDLFLCP